MPHSGGGGSSSSGTSSSGGNGGGSGSGGRKMSSTYFSGARTFYYYDDNEKPVFIYSDFDLKASNIFRKFLLIIYIPFLLILSLCLLTTFHSPKKITTAIDNEIIIEDNEGVLGDTSYLMKELEDFKEATGIVPAIVTTNDTVWNTKYDNLENYAYSVYVNHFPDEGHFLILYSLGNDKWSYELMEGDDTSHILTNNENEIINEKLFKYLTANSRYTTSNAIGAVFNETTPNIMKIYCDIDGALCLICMILFVFIHMYFMVFKKTPTPCKLDDLHELKGAKEKPEVATCEYCHGLYVVGSTLTCPHCGAAVTKY